MAADSTNGSNVLHKTSEEVKALFEEVNGIKAGVQELAAKEGELLKAEIAEQRKLIVRAAGFGALAAVAAFLTLAFLAVTLMALLDGGMETWLAALITALVLGAILGAAAYMAYETFRKISPLPKRTINSLKEDAEWLGILTKSSGR